MHEEIGKNGTKLKGHGATFSNELDWADRL